MMGDYYPVWPADAEHERALQEEAWNEGWRAGQDAGRDEAFRDAAAVIRELLAALKENH